MSKTYQKNKPVKLGEGGTIKDFLESEGKVLVDFYADWCGPCQMMEPKIEELAEETDALILKVDIDLHPELADEYGVNAVPTFVAFSSGKEKARSKGAQDKDKLKQMLR